MSDVNQVDSEEEGLAYGYSADEAEPTTQPDQNSEEETGQAATDEAAASATVEQQADHDSAPAQQPATESEESVVKKLDGRMRNMQGEINRLTKHLAEQSAAATAAVEQQGGDAPSASQVKAAMVDGEKMAALREEFPEWAEALNEQGEEIERRVLSKVKATDVSGLATKDEIAQFRQTLPVLIKHPTFEDDIKTTEFSAWFDAQPNDVKSLADSDKPKDAISLMDKFYGREAKPSPKNNSQQRLQSAVAPTTGANRPRQGVMSEDDAMRIGYNAT